MAPDPAPGGRSAVIEAPYLPPADLDEAILQTVAYSDVFDYPLTDTEIHRYLVGLPASLDAVRSALAANRLLPERLACLEGYYFLPDRESTVEKRLRRAQVSAALWPRAIHYGLIIARLPFVRMVAITGALSMNNSDPGDDLDYFIITELGRLWLCRAFVIGLVRAAARCGEIICPNYFVSERALEVSERNLYTAHEMTQMVPVSGLGLYERLRETNPWVREFLPNAVGAPRTLPSIGADPYLLWDVAEMILRTPPGAWLEQWDMNRKMRKLQAQISASNPIEAEFGVDWCKGHFGGYGRRTLGALADRMASVDD